VLGLADSHMAKALARELYQDTTPPPTPEEIEMRRIERVYKATAKAVGRPTRDDRRARRKMTGKD
jgi:hypothetical protein